MLLLRILASYFSLSHVKRTEERIAQCHRLDTLHVHIVEQIRIQVEENRHVHSLACIETLLFKAETLDLAEVRRTLRGRHTVCSHSNDVLVTLVGRLVECQRGLARKDTDFSLLRDKLPGQDVGDRSAEGDLDSLGVFDGNESACEITIIRAGTTMGTYGLTSPASGLADLYRC